MEKVSDNDKKSIDNIVTILERHSLQCRCGSLAIPEVIQGHVYKCIACHKSYDGVSYNFSRLLSKSPNTEDQTLRNNVQLDYFNEAIDILRRKNPITQTNPNLLKKLWRRLKN